MIEKFFISLCGVYEVSNKGAQFSNMIDWRSNNMFQLSKKLQTELLGLMFLNYLNTGSFLGTHPYTPRLFDREKRSRI